MCGRYRLFYERDVEELNRILAEVLARHPHLPAGRWMLPEEVFPTNQVPVLTAEQGGVAADLFTWGFPGFADRPVIINARSETAGEKPMFRDCLRSRRCAVPSTGFYEWSHTGKKRKYLFTGDEPMLYMAGLYKTGAEGERRFVILTADANDSMRDIHDRMPVMLAPDKVEDWILDDADAARLLASPPPLLERERVG